MITTNPFYKLKLDNEEQQIERDSEAGKFLPVSDLAAQRARLKKIAEHTLNKNKVINLQSPHR